jgi:putative DNA primase/helicase
MTKPCAKSGQTSNTNTRVPRFGEIAGRLAENGYRPLPLIFGQKCPAAGEGWPRYEFNKSDLERYASAGTGLLCGDVVALDIDVRDKKLAGELDALAEQRFGAAPRRIGQPPKALRLLRAEASFTKRATRGYRLPGDGPEDKAHRVEVLARGQQVVAFNEHPDTHKPYTWNGAGDPLTVPIGLLPTCSEAQAREFVAAADALLAQHGRPVGKLTEADEGRAHEANEQQRAADPALLRQALAALPNDDVEFDDWLRVLYATKGALGDEGLDDFLHWSAKSAAKDKPENSTREYRAARPLKIGAGSIFYLAREAGWGRAAHSIPLTPGKLHEAVRASIEALAQHSEQLNLFQRGDFLVRPTLVEGYGFKGADGERPITHSLRLKRPSATTIRIELSRVATFTKEVGRKCTEVVVDCPKDLAQAVYESDDRWHDIPTIEAVSETPLYDGRTLYCGPGVRLGVYVDAPRIELPQRLRKQDAAAALERVSGWIDEFRFTDPKLDRAALLAFFLTAAVRFSIDHAPGFAITKHDFGAGGTTATKMAAILATGREPSVMPCSNEQELEKQVTASLIHGANVRILDNLPEGTELSSRLLAQSLSERLVRVRVLGESREVECSTPALVAVTGVNIQTAADLNRRVIRISLDPRMSSPETRVFRRKNILEMLARERPAILRDLFTITHAYITSGETTATGDLAGFDHWVRWVAQPLVWLGEENVLRTVQAASAADPSVAMLRRVIPLISQLTTQLGARAGGVLASEMIGKADAFEGERKKVPDDVRRTQEALREAFGEATGARQFDGEWQLNARMVGKWLSAHHGKPIADGEVHRRIAKGKEDRDGNQRWRVEVLGTGQ